MTDMSPINAAPAPARAPTPVPAPAPTDTDTTPADGVNFENACDRLSHLIDRSQFERLQWERNVAPMLARLVTLAHGALEERGEFELIEEGATQAIKRFVLKVHSNRIFAIALRVEGSRVLLTSENISRSRYRLLAGEPISAEYSVVNEAWMAAALEQVFNQIQAPPEG